MNFTTAVFLVNENARAMRCVYEPAPDDLTNNSHEKLPRAPLKEYVFKTLDQTIHKDDLCVVPSGTRHGFTVVKVIEEDVDVDLDAPFEMKWIVAKVDTVQYQSLLDMEKDAVSKIRKADIRKKRSDLATNLFKDNIEEMKALDLANVGATALPK
jgi:hypothetical protein